MTLDEAEKQGFDGSSEVCSEDDMDIYVRVRCSQCAAVVINGVACHELGCPNAAKARRQQEARDREEEYSEPEEEEDDG